MRVQILKPVILLGEIKKSGVIEVPESSGKHWIATGAAKLAVEPAAGELPLAVEPPPTKAPAAGGKKGF